MILILSVFLFLGLREILPERLFSATPVTGKNMLIDSMLLDALEQQDLSATNDQIAEDAKSSPKVVYPETQGLRFPSEKYDDYHGYQYMMSFFEDLLEHEKSGKGNIRIAYFGDSMTDGDMIVQDFRSNFQQDFGGSGVGFVSITSESAASRSSISHQFSNNWKTQSYLNVKYPRKPFGINGHVFFAADTSRPAWVNYKGGLRKLTSQLPNPTLFYGRSSNQHGIVRLTSGRDTIIRTLQPKSMLNTISFSDAALKSLKAEFVQADSIPLYGFNFDDGVGVHVDNFSQRGNSGIPISKFDVSLMTAFQQKLDYDLIILHYGTNVLNYGTKSYGWYEKSMTKTVGRLRQCFPGVPILIVSTADKATKYDMEMKTDSAVVPLASAQRRYALQTQSAFVNLYTLMGGDGSMVKWVENETPALANKDYTHFNYQGSRKIGRLLYSQIMDGFTQYKKLRGVPRVTPENRIDSTNTNTASLND